MPLTTALDGPTWAALTLGQPRPISEARANATEAPSEAARAAKTAERVGSAAVGVGVTEAALSPFGGISGVLDWITGASEKVGALTDAFTPFKDLFAVLASNWMLIAIAAGIGLLLIGRRVFRDELASFQNGEWS